MPGLDPGIHWPQLGDMREGGGWVYIMTNRPNGTLYLGVTKVDIAHRAWEHRPKAWSTGSRSGTA